MSKPYQFKTRCKGDSHSYKTANIILPGLMTKQRWTPLRVQAQSHSNSSAWMLVETTLVMEFHAWWQAASHSAHLAPSAQAGLSGACGQGLQAAR